MSEVWNRGEGVGYIIPEKNCYVIVAEDTYLRGDKELFCNKDDVDYLKEKVPYHAKTYKIEDPPESFGSCPEYWEDGENYICKYWGNDVASFRCYCIDIPFEDED